MIFWKMSGAGNDFIMLNGLESGSASSPGRDQIASMCRRGLSVGADGLIEIRRSEDRCFRMKYYNSDGGEAEMCGNGARCICRFALELGLVGSGEEFLFESDAGVHRGLVTGDAESRIWMTEPEIFFLSRAVDTGIMLETGFVYTGVPHAVVFTDNLEDGSFEKYAPVLRSHREFGSAGANADWVKITGDGSLQMRTWERGVEGETLACGTGAVASALIASMKYDHVDLPVKIGVKSGLELTVGHDESGWWLQGESRLIYRGEILL